MNTSSVPGVHNDCEKLLTKFVEVPSVRYEHFKQCFVGMKFSLIYSGRNNEVELREFEECVLIIALKFCFLPYGFQVRVGGLYLIYSLYYTQPMATRMNIRVTVEQWRELSEFVEMLKEQLHYDACFIYYKMVRENAFYICFNSREFNLLHFHKHEDRTDYRPTNSLHSEERPLSDLCDNDAFLTIMTLHDRYWQMKCQLNSDRGEPTEGLDLVVDDPCQTVIHYVEEFEKKEGIKLEKARQADGLTASTSAAHVGNVRNAIRSKAMILDSERYFRSPKKNIANEHATETGLEAEASGPPNDSLEDAVGGQIFKSYEPSTSSKRKRVIVGPRSAITRLAQSGKRASYVPEVSQEGVSKYKDLNLKPREYVLPKLPYPETAETSTSAPIREKKGKKAKKSDHHESDIPNPISPTKSKSGISGQEESDGVSDLEPTTAPSPGSKKSTVRQKRGSAMISGATSKKRISKRKQQLPVAARRANIVKKFKSKNVFVDPIDADVHAIDTRFLELERNMEDLKPKKSKFFPKPKNEKN